MRHSITIFAVAISFALSGAGCTGVGTKTFEEFDINEGTSVSIDATQRVILVKRDGSNRMVCAEPSPDALVAAAAQVAAKADVPNAGNGEFSGTVSQTASSIGIRTATIQLLRDGYFRACEAAMNGMLEPESYQKILAGITPVMVGLVAIDGLTQMDAAPIVTVGAAPGATSPEGRTSAANFVTAHVDRTNAPSSADDSVVSAQVVKIVELVLENQSSRLNMELEKSKK